MGMIIHTDLIIQFSRMLRHEILVNYMKGTSSLSVIKCIHDLVKPDLPIIYGTSLNIDDKSTVNSRYL